MNAQKTSKTILSALILAVVSSSSAAFGAALTADMRNDLNQVLNKNLSERELVIQEYRANPAAERPENHFDIRNGEKRIEVVIDGELNGSASDRLADHDRSDRIYRERRIQAKLDKELKAVAHDSEQEILSADKPLGFSYSEAK